jgi:hypothetical protein
MSKKPTEPRSEAKLIVYGQDQAAKPRAAWFTAKDAEAARKAAQQLELQVWEIVGPISPELLKKIGAGRVAATGDNVTNKVPRAIYDEVKKLALITDPARQLLPKMGDAEKGAAKKLKPDELHEIERQIVDVANERRISRLPADWNAIQKGSLVIANYQLDEGWWEAIVTDRVGDMLFIRWRDHPKIAPAVRHRSTVALISPTAN